MIIDDIPPSPWSHLFCAPCQSIVRRPPTLWAFPISTANSRSPIVRKTCATLFNVSIEMKFGNQELKGASGLNRMKLKGIGTYSLEKLDRVLTVYIVTAYYIVRSFET